MEKTIALLLAISALTLAGCSPTSDAAKADSQKSAIESVFAQRAKLKAEDEQIGLLSDRHVGGLMAIDVQNCPADFRSAWFDFLITAQSLHSRVKLVAMIAAGEGKPVTDFPSLIKFGVSDPTLGRYMLAALSKEDEASDKVERTAMNYGVMPKY